MTTKRTDKPGVGAPLQKKPYLKGRAFSGLAVRCGVRILTYLVLSAVLFFFLGQLLVVDIAWLRTLINLMVVAALAALLYNHGAQAGEADVAFAEIALVRRSEGREVPQKDIDRCFHPLKGFVTAFFGALPLILLCLVYALTAVRESYTLGPLPSWLSAYESRADVGLALEYYHDRAGFGLADVLRLVVRLLVFPFINIAGSRNADAVLLVERLSPLLVFLPPLFYGIGYARGEYYRARVHAGIAANARKAARKRRKKPQPRRQEPRQLV